MSNGLISITKNSKIKYLRGAFKIDNDTWKINIVPSIKGSYMIFPVHGWHSYQFDNGEIQPGYVTMLVKPDFWFYEHCKQWLKHQELLNYNKKVERIINSI